MTASLTAKHRPQTFADVAGQDTLKAILSRASAENKVAPAYLFSGTRGVGKTTLARIFAKALNCRNAPTAEPCNVCDQCHAVTMGNSVDVIEIDGASNRGIDDVRRLKEVVGYAPMEGRYKIFIIDEAHMLSREAFNALLKTLEEPPANVTFIMATTEPHKFPATIISRCQHYVFKRLPDNGIIAHLSRVLQKENISFEQSALQLIARRGAGSVRDSMSLLGQVLALGTGELTEEITRNVLGLAGQEALFHMAEALAEGQTLTVAHTIGDLMDQGLDIGFFLRELTALWRNLFILRQSGEAGKTAIDAPEAQKNMLLDLSSRFSLSHIHACWQMTIEGQRRVLTSMEPGLALELLLMNLAMLPQLLSLDGLSAMARRTMPPTPQGTPPMGGNRAANRVTNTPQPAPNVPSLQRSETSASKAQSSSSTPMTPPGDSLGQPLPSSLSANNTIRHKQEMKAEKKEEQKDLQQPFLHAEQQQKETPLNTPQVEEQSSKEESAVSRGDKESALDSPKEGLHQNIQDESSPLLASEHSSLEKSYSPTDVAEYKNLSENDEAENLASTSLYASAEHSSLATMQKTQDSLYTEKSASHAESNTSSAYEENDESSAESNTSSSYEEGNALHEESSALHEENDTSSAYEASVADHISETDNSVDDRREDTLEVSLASQPAMQKVDSLHADWKVVIDWCAEHALPPWFMPLVKNITATWDGDTLLLQPNDAFIGQRLMAPSSRELLDPALTEVYGFLPAIELLQPIKKAKDRAAIKEKVHSHPHIKILEETFEARIVDFGEIQ